MKQEGKAGGPWPLAPAPSPPSPTQAAPAWLGYPRREGVVRRRFEEPFSIMILWLLPNSISITGFFRIDQKTYSFDT
jgi:hypothetical protein